MSKATEDVLQQHGRYVATTGTRLVISDRDGNQGPERVGIAAIIDMDDYQRLEALGDLDLATVHSLMQALADGRLIGLTGDVTSRTSPKDLLIEQLGTCTRCNESLDQNVSVLCQVKQTYELDLKTGDAYNHDWLPGTQEFIRYECGECGQVLDTRQHALVEDIRNPRLATPERQMESFHQTMDRIGRRINVNLHNSHNHDTALLMETT